MEEERKWQSPCNNETPTRADYNRSAEFKVDKKDDFWKMAIPFVLGLMLGWAGSEIADNASREATNYRGDGYHGGGLSNPSNVPGGSGVYTTPGSSLNTTPGNSSGLDTSGSPSGSTQDGSSAGSGRIGSPNTDPSGINGGVSVPNSR